MITVFNNQPVVSSRQVAADFDKEHKHILTSIREILKAENSAFAFYHETSYKVEGNTKEYPEFLMNRDGFTLLVMGFTGKDALQWKIRYIQAFNEMEAELKRQAAMRGDPIMQNAGAYEYLNLVDSGQRVMKSLLRHYRLTPFPATKDTIAQTLDCLGAEISGNVERARALLSRETQIRQLSLAGMEVAM